MENNTAIIATIAGIISAIGGSVITGLFGKKSNDVDALDKAVGTVSKVFDELDEMRKRLHTVDVALASELDEMRQRLHAVDDALANKSAEIDRLNKISAHHESVIEKQSVAITTMQATIDQLREENVSLQNENSYLMKRANERDRSNQDVSTQSEA